MSNTHYRADRINAIQPFHVMRLLAKAKQLEAAGHDVVHMEVGEPDFTAPQPVMTAARSALSQRKTFYTPALGLPALRQALAGYYQRRFQLKVPSSRIAITPGASGAIQLVMALLLNPGDEVLLTDPGYPCYRNFAYLFEAQPVSVPTGPETHFQFTPELLRQHWKPGKTRMVILSSPANPTGAVMTKEALCQIAQTVRELGGFLVVDEIYQGLIYDAEDFTGASCGDDIFIINSFSKYFCMTGWRLGWLIAPQVYIPDLDKLAQNIYLAAPTPSQYAALAALEEDSLKVLQQRRVVFQQRRDYLLNALQSMGFRVPHIPQGAFYIYADVSSITADSDQLAESLLMEAHVATTPGKDFAVNNPHRYLRFAYTADIDRLRNGVARIQQFL